MLYDLIIIGGGPAGLTSAIYATRNKLKTLLLSKEKGKLSLTPVIENYPGFKSVSGMELLKKFEEQAVEFGAEIKEDAVLELKSEKGIFKVQTRENKYEGKSVILAMGTEKAKLNIENEDKFIGRGISYCAICDAGFFKDKIVGVIGGSNSAAMSALLLARHAKKVYIIYRKEELRAEKIIVDKLLEAKVEIIKNSVVKKAQGKNVLEEVILEQNGEERTLKLNGLFIEVGYIPATILAKETGIELENKFIKINEKLETNVEGIFAAGDITTDSGKVQQIITACSEGAIASISAYKYLKNKN